MAGTSLTSRHRLLIWLGGSLLLLFMGWAQLSGLTGWDPDDQLRLVQLRDLLAGQPLNDPTQYRLNAPEGSSMHWSRFIELPLALIILLLRPLLGQAGAEMAAGAIMPLTLLGVSGWLLGDVLRRMGRAAAAPVAMLLCFLMPAMLAQFMPMRIDHHGWQIMLACLSFWSLFDAKERRSGAVLGAALALWLHISMEAAPLMAMFFGWLGLRWGWFGEGRQRLFATVASFALTSGALSAIFTANPFHAPNWCDAVSPAHLAAIGFAAVVMLLATLWTNAPRVARLAAGAAAGGGALAILAVMAPSCLSGGGFAALDPLVREVWYNSVTEGLPVWRQGDIAMLGLLLPAVCGLIALWLGRKRGLVGGSALHAMLWFQAASLLVAILVMRSASTACALAIPALAIWLSDGWTRYRAEADAAKRVKMLVAMFALVMAGPLWTQLAKTASGMVSRDAAPVSLSDYNQGCSAPAEAVALGQLPKARVIAPFDMGPAILAATPHSVLASSHHRNMAGMRDQIRLFLGSAADARSLVRARGIGYILVCKDNPEMKSYARRAPQGFFAELERGKAPDWLEPVKLSDSDLQIWRVKAP